MAATSEVVPTKTTPTPAAAAASVDHTARLLEQIGSSRMRGEMLRVKRISASHYRVNYLAATGLGADVHLPSYKIVRSKFLKVQDVNGTLEVTDQTR